VTYQLYSIYQRHDLPPHADAMFLAQRGEVRFPDREHCHWATCTPNAGRVFQTNATIDVFLERDGSYQYLGEAGVASYGRSRWDAQKQARLHLHSTLPRDRWLALIEPLPPRDQEPPESAIAALTDRSSTLDRIAAMRRFVERWSGTDEDAAALPAMPSPLAALHRLTRANPRIVCQNQLVAPDRLIDVEGRTVFYVENQGVCAWAFETASGDDPPVWFHINDHRESWQREREPLSGFLIQLAIFESIWISSFGAAAGSLPIESADQLRARFDPLPLAPWSWGPTTFYARDGALLTLMENGDDAFTVQVAALHPDALTFIDDLVDDQWDVVSF
jgi:hypothetical protein